MATKQCASCAELKPYEDFYLKSRVSDYPTSDAGLSHACKACVRSMRKQYREKNLAQCNRADNNSRLKRVYGIDVEEYNRMFAAQDGKCPGCERHQSELKFKLAVGHDHVTGQVRGLLCITCNLTLGYVKDSPHILTNLIKYINKSYTELAAQSNVLVFKPVTKAG